MLGENPSLQQLSGAPNTAFETSAKKFQESARRDIAAADASGPSTLAVLLRLIVPLAALPMYWWIRFPALFPVSDRVFSGLETGLALVLTAIGSCCAADATVQLFARIRRA